MNPIQLRIWNKGYHARYRGELRHDAIRLYKRKHNRDIWMAGWDQAEAEVVMADFANKQNQFCLLNPRNPFFGKTKIDLWPDPLLSLL